MDYARLAAILMSIEGEIYDPIWISSTAAFDLLLSNGETQATVQNPDKWKLTPRYESVPNRT